jgi:hypothetical protein
LEKWCCSIVASYYVRRGGNTSDGNGCGIFNVLCVLADGAFWPIGAALSFKPYIHIMLFVVIVLAMVPLVVSFLLVLTLLLLLQVGTLVLLYNFFILCSSWWLL